MHKRVGSWGDACHGCAFRWFGSGMDRRAGEDRSQGWLVDPVFGENPGKNKFFPLRQFHPENLVSHKCSSQGFDRSSEQAVSRPLFRYEPSADSGDQLQRRAELCQHRYAGRQPICGFVVVPHGIHPFCGQTLWLNFDRINNRAKYLAQRRSNRYCGSPERHVPYVGV